VSDVVQFAKGSDLDCSNYVALTLWINVDKNWGVDDEFTIYGYDTTGTIAVIGNAVNLDDYFNPATMDTWQKIVIPINDMGLGTLTIDALRISCTSTGGKDAKFYIDNMEFQETGIPVTFSLTPDKGQWLHVDEFTISVADEYAGTVSDGTMPCIPYDSFLGETLINGINYNRIQDGETMFSLTVRTLMDFMQLAGTELVGYGSDGTNTWLTIRAKNSEPLVLKYEDDDSLNFTVSEDLTGLLHFRISAGCRVESDK